MNYVIPDYVEYAIKKLNSNGFEAYVVGGAVRDIVIGLTPKDWDIATNASVLDVEKCFDKYFETGIKHGTVTVLVDKKPLEITTYRIEGEYEDNRRPKEVYFTSSLKEDLKRRDFTVNAMAYNAENGIVDMFGGKKDIENKIIRCVGEPDKRFSEDALRMMRAIRFSSRLGFTIEENTMKSIIKNRSLLKNISIERIREELLGIIIYNDGISQIFKSGISDIIIPEIKTENPSLKNLKSEVNIRIAALIDNVNEDCARQILERFKFDNKTKKSVLNILKIKRENIKNSAYEIRTFIYKYGKEDFLNGVYLKKASGEKTDEIINIYEDVKYDPCTVKELDITGNDIVNIGITGKKTGEAINYLMNKVLENPMLNSKELLLKTLLEIK
ncbi:MAG: CCA tRNA nucleotidyltransferase [Clostridia bacterium]|nr:CCA tRNA nucleotidyltransferase [Clostridia bacterium]